MSNDFYNLNSKATLGDYKSITPYNSNFIPEERTTTGQKRYSTEASRPNLPKPETMFYVHFNINKNAQSIINNKTNLAQYLINIKDKSIGEGLLKSDELSVLAYELSKFVESTNKPNITFGVKEYNEYNRKRLVYSSVSYGDIKISFFDVKENPVEKFFFNYLKIINNNFLCKDYTDYQAEIKTNEFVRDGGYWGFGLDSNFKLIDKISICEFYMDKLMVYTIENPVIKNIDFGSNKTGSFSPNKITVTFGYEGITNDLLDIRPHEISSGLGSENYLKNMVNANITEAVAQFLNMRYVASNNDASITVDEAYRNNDVINAQNVITLGGNSSISSLNNQILKTGNMLANSTGLTNLVDVTGYDSTLSVLSQAEDVVSMAHKLKNAEKLIDIYKNNSNKLNIDNVNYVLTAVSSDPSVAYGTKVTKKTSDIAASLIKLYK